MLLGVGLAQVGIEGAAVVIGFMLVLAWRERVFPEWKSRWRYNFLQIMLAGFALTAIGTMFEALRTGLVSVPEMDVTGWGSSDHSLFWYQDRVLDLLPQVGVWSVPLWVYRVVMLAWALWLASFMSKYARRAAVSFSAGGLWRSDRD